MNCAFGILLQNTNIPIDIINMILDYIIEPAKITQKLLYDIRHMTNIPQFIYNHTKQQRYRHYKTIINQCLSNPILNKEQTHYISLQEQLQLYNDRRGGYECHFAEMEKMDLFYIFNWLKTNQKKYKVLKDCNRHYHALKCIKCDYKTENYTNRVINYDKQTRDYSHINKKHTEIIKLSQQNMFSIIQQKYKKSLNEEINNILNHIRAIKCMTTIYPTDQNKFMLHQKLSGLCFTTSKDVFGRNPEPTLQNIIVSMTTTNVNHITGKIGLNMKLRKSTGDIIEVKKKTTWKSLWDILNLDEWKERGSFHYDHLKTIQVISFNLSQLNRQYKLGLNDTIQSIKKQCKTVTFHFTQNKILNKIGSIKNIYDIEKKCYNFKNKKIETLIYNLYYHHKY